MPNPKKPLKLLLVDDSEDDRELIMMNLRRGGYNPDETAVDTKEGFKDALDEDGWDLIICDYNMPEFDGLTALGILKERHIDIPFILVSGAIGEELAVQAMKAGANDYMMKDSLKRLIPAIERELKEAKLRVKHREAQIERDRLLTVIQNSLNEIYIFDCNTLKFQYLNQTAINNLGYDFETVQDMTPIDINPYLDSAEDYKRIIQPLLNGDLEKDLYLTKHIRKDGSTYPIEIHLQLISQNNQQFFTAIGFDLTDREKDARRIQEQKEIAKELAEHSKHKSEFLANMSHELRTPLNSILLLSKLLIKSGSNNFSANQLKYIDVIQQSGKSLLSLINEILDLSKIESGEMELSFDEVSLDDLIAGITNVFESIASEKNLDFSVAIYENVPKQIVTDQLRLEQVLRNLLSNAMKFTNEGGVDLNVLLETEPDKPAGEQIIFSVKDTGIGIPENKQELVFESFRQADGSTQRKFGGTGLGLSICRQIAELLGGELTLKSAEGAGSTFTLSLPLKKADSSIPGAGAGHGTENYRDPISQPGAALHSPDVLLISENPVIVAALRRHMKTLSKELKVLKSAKDIFAAISRYAPKSVLIDPCISGLSGWSEAKRILDKSNHAPSVWMITDEAQPVPALNLPGLSGIAVLPLDISDVKTMVSFSPMNVESSERKKTLLLIDDNKIHNEALSEFAKEIVDQCLIAPTAKDAFEILETASVDCIVLDLTLPDATGDEVLKQLAADPALAGTPVIIYSGRSLTNQQKNELLTHASDVILKNVGSHSKLMRRISEVINTAGRDDVKASEPSTSSILVVDDDDQSYFSMSSLLKSEGRMVIRAAGGHEALRVLQTRDDEIGLVLLDLMMPEMDGFETIKRIRHDLKMTSLPVVIVTAKAMKGDREECLRHGATDYISKPVSPEKLEELISVWMP